MRLWYVIDGKVMYYCWQETDGKRSVMVRAETAEAALRMYERFQRGEIKKETIGVGERTIAVLL